MKLLRITAKWKEASNPDEGRMTFDVLVNDENMAAYRFITFGAVCRDIENPSIFWPFSLNEDGEMTYSGEDQPPESTHRINIYKSKKIHEGQYFTFFEEEHESTYEIVRVQDLTETMK